MPACPVEPAVPHPHALPIAAATTDSPPSSPRERFHALVQEIDRARSVLAMWHERGSAHDAAVTPVVDTYFALLREWIVALDVTLGQRPWSRQHRDQLRALLQEAVAEWTAAEGDDPQMKALYGKHAGLGFDTAQAPGAEPRAPMPEPWPPTGDAGHHADAVHSVRAVYRRLASALHPDRERDATERVAKTAMMQRVNQAYDAKDLLALLTLQREVSPTGAHPLASASEESVAHYNEVLAGQLGQLTRAVHDEAARYRNPAAGEPEPAAAMDPERVDEVLREAAQAWADGVAELRRDVQMLRSATATKQWLEAMRFDPRRPGAAAHAG